jgi:uncharacterized protein YuzE
MRKTGRRCAGGAPCSCHRALYELRHHLRSVQVFVCAFLAIMHLHYDPEVDITLLSFERGKAVSEEHDWCLIDRDREDGHLMGFEIWDARRRLPA